MYNFAIAVVLLPFLGAIGSFLAETGRRAAHACIAGAFPSAATSLWLLGWHIVHWRDAAFTNALSFWDFPAAGGVAVAYRGTGISHFAPQVGVQVDGISLVLMPIVALAGFAILWHSARAMRGDGEFRRLFWVGGCAISAALAAVVSPNLFQLVVASGLTSAFVWILATHWWPDAEIASRGRYAFITARVSDAALLLATVVVFVKFATSALAQPTPTTVTVNDPFSFTVFGTEIRLAQNHGVPGVGSHTITLLAILFAIAGLGRLAQIPLHIGLLDVEQAALPGLLIAALVAPVTGLVLLLRVYPSLLAATHVLSVIAIIGALTALVGAVMAFAQRDIARFTITVVITQLGVLVTGLGVGGFSVSITTYAAIVAFTGALMMGCSNLVRAYRTRAIEEMSGAWRTMPLTTVILGVSVLGIAGAGFEGYGTFASLIRNEIPGGGHVTHTVEYFTGAAVALALVILTAACVHVVRRVAGGSAVDRRGFNAARIAEAPGPLLRSAWFMLIGGVATIVVSIPAQRLSLSHLAFFGGVRQNLSLITSAAVIAGVVAVAGLVVGALIPVRRAVTTATTLPATGARGLVESGGRIQGWLPAGVAFASTRVAQFVTRTDAEVVDPLMRGFGEAFALLEMPTRRGHLRSQAIAISTAFVLVVVVIVAVVVYAAAHGAAPPS